MDTRTQAQNVQNVPLKTVEYKCQALKNSFGLIDHYFIVIDDKEFHLGEYRFGKILPNGTTKGAHVVERRDICIECYNKIIADFNFREDRRLITYYPMLNCESLSTGFSSQSLVFLAIPFIGIMLIKGQLIYAILIFLLAIICLLWYSKYMFSDTKKSKCMHLSDTDH